MTNYSVFEHDRMSDEELAARAVGLDDDEAREELERRDREDWLVRVQEKYGRINTTRHSPAVPWEWYAVRDNDEGEEGAPRGFGATEESAINDLIDEIEDAKP